MANKWYIDGIDIQESYGVYVAANGYNGVLSFPPLKQPDFNDWPEREGIDVDLSNPVLDNKEFQLGLTGVFGADVAGFFALLKTGVYHIFDFDRIKVCRKLRAVAVPEYSGVLITNFSITLADDFPIEYRNLCPTPAVNITSNLYGFGVREIILTAGIKYIITVNGSAGGALNGHYLKTYIHNTDWSYNESIDITELVSTTKTLEISAPATGVYYLESFYFDNSEPRTGNVTVNWYKVEEKGLPSFEYGISGEIPSLVQGYILDGKNDLSVYGISVLAGSDEKIEKAQDSKLPQIIKNQISAGAAVDYAYVCRYKNKTVVLKLQARAATFAELVQNMNSFLSDLKEAGEHSLYAPRNGGEYSFYYKSSSVTAIDAARPTIFFDLTLEFIR